MLGCENGGLYVEDTTGVVRNAEVRGIHATATNVAAPGIVVAGDSDLLVQDSVLAYVFLRPPGIIFVLILDIVLWGGVFMQI